MMQKTRFLVDTDIIINYLRGGDNARDFIMTIIEGGTLGFFSVITEAELLSGSRNADDNFAIYSVLDCMEAIVVERNIAATAGRLRQKYYSTHKTELPDAIIAGRNDFAFGDADNILKHLDNIKNICSLV